MTLYIILTFAALCAGMAVSVYAFGTGGKRKRIFQDIYPVQKYSADIDSYYEFTSLLAAIAQTLGEGYAIHKQDVFVRKRFEDGTNERHEFLSAAEDGTNERHEFLSAAYFRYFNGRSYTDSTCYLTVTQEARKSGLFSFDGKKWRDFLVKCMTCCTMRAYRRNFWENRRRKSLLTATSP